MFSKFQLVGKDKKVSVLSDKKITEARTDVNDVLRCNSGLHGPYYIHCHAMLTGIITVGSYLYLSQRISSFGENLQRGLTNVVTR
jgi:hypothetical protein